MPTSARLAGRSSARRLPGFELPTPDRAVLRIVHLADEPHPHAPQDGGRRVVLGQRVRDHAAHEVRRKRRGGERPCHALGAALSGVRAERVVGDLYRPVLRRRPIERARADDQVAGPVHRQVSAPPAGIVVVRHQQRLFHDVADDGQVFCGHEGAVPLPQRLRTRPQGPRQLRPDRKKSHVLHKRIVRSLHPSVPASCSRRSPKPLTELPRIPSRRSSQDCLSRDCLENARRLLNGGSVAARSGQIRGLCPFLAALGASIRASFRFSRQSLYEVEGIRARPRLLRSGPLGPNSGAPQALMPFSSRVSSSALSQFWSILLAISSSSARFWRATSAVSASPAFSARRSRSW